MLIAAPKIAQALCAALGDFYTWKLGRRIFGEQNNEAWSVVCGILHPLSLKLKVTDRRFQLLLTTLNPWQWFCSTRTLSNCLEATLTIVALYHWPWHWVEEEPENIEHPKTNASEYQEEDYVHVDQGSPRISEASTMLQSKDDETFSRPLQLDQNNSLRICLGCAAVACILRPTNILIWLSLSCSLFLRKTTYGFFTETRWLSSPVWIDVTTIRFLRSAAERWQFLREGIFCGYVPLAALRVAFNRG